MPVSVTNITPWAPAYPVVGGVVGDKFIMAASSSSTDKGTFGVVDPVAETINAFQMTAPAGDYGFNHGRYGGALDGGLWAAFGGSGTGDLPIFLVKMKTDGDYDLHPSTKTLYASAYPVTVVTDSEVWFLSEWDSLSGGVFDVATSVWTAHTLTATKSTSEPVFGHGTVWVWSGATLYAFDASTKARTLVLTHTHQPASGTQVATIGSKAFWVSSTLNIVIELDMSTGSVTNHTPGISLGAGNFAAGPDGRLYQSAAAAVKTFDPATLATTSDAVASASGSCHRSGFAAGLLVSAHR